MARTGEVVDAYIALRANHDVAEAAAKAMADFSLSSQGLIDALGAEILNGSRTDFNKVQEYRNEVLSHFTKRTK